MIMAAGRGSRMRPLTDYIHKGLLKVNGTPLIEHHVKKLAAIGITDIVINVSYLAEQIITYLGKGEKYDVRIHYSIEDKPLEVGGGIIKALPLLNQELFIVINCDVWSDYPLSQLTENIGNALGKIVLVKNPIHNSKGDFSLDGCKVSLNYEENIPSNSFTYAGIAVYKPELFTNFARGCPQPMRPILLKAIRLKKLNGEVYSGSWMDVGTPERLAELNIKS